MKQAWPDTNMCPLRTPFPWVTVPIAQAAARNYLDLPFFDNRSLKAHDVAVALLNLGLRRRLIPGRPSTREHTLLRALSRPECVPARKPRKSRWIRASIRYRAARLLGAIRGVSML